MTVQVSDAVVYVDERRATHKALVTAVWGNPDQNPSINLVYVTKDKSMQDEYGQQIRRETSVVHSNNQPANARCWNEIQ